MLTINTGFMVHSYTNGMKYKTKKKGLELENAVVFDSEEGKNKNNGSQERESESEANRKNLSQQVHIDIIA